MDAIQEMVLAGLGLSNQSRLYLSFGPDRGLWISEMVAQVLDVEYPVSRTAPALPRVTCDHDSYSTGCDAGGILRAFLTEWMELFITARCVPGGGVCSTDQYCLPLDPRPSAFSFITPTRNAEQVLWEIEAFGRVVTLAVFHLGFAPWPPRPSAVS